MKSAPAGHRFRDQHKRTVREGNTSGWMRGMFLGGAVATFLIGIVFLFTPGPSFVFFIVAAALLSSQWRPVAALMDRLEIKMRESWTRLKRGWTALRHKLRRTHRHARH